MMILGIHNNIIYREIILLSVNELMKYSKTCKQLEEPGRLLELRKGKEIIIIIIIKFNIKNQAELWHLRDQIKHLKIMLYKLATTIFSCFFFGHKHKTG